MPRLKMMDKQQIIKEPCEEDLKTARFTLLSNHTTKPCIWTQRLECKSVESKKA